MDSELACEEVASGALELAVVTLPTQPDPKLQAQLIWPDPLAIVCSTDHPLAGENVTSDILADHAAVLPAPGTITRDVLFEALSKSRMSVNTTLETNYLETIKMMVSVGLGWSALPVSMMDDSISEIKVRGLKVERQLGFVLYSWHVVFKPQFSTLR